MQINVTFFILESYQCSSYTFPHTFFFKKIMTPCFCSQFVGADRLRGFYSQAEVSKYVSSLKQVLFLTHVTEIDTLPFHNALQFIIWFSHEIPMS